MRFVSIGGSKGSYQQFIFESHDPLFVNNGDQIWSNGECVEIYEGIDKGELLMLVGMVKNKKAFQGALRLTGFNLD